MKNWQNGKNQLPRTAQKKSQIEIFLFLFIQALNVIWLWICVSFWGVQTPQFSAYCQAKIRGAQAQFSIGVLGVGERALASEGWGGGGCVNPAGIFNRPRFPRRYSLYLWLTIIWLGSAQFVIVH